MTKRIQGNVNYSDEGFNLDPITANSATSTLLLPAFDITTQVLPISLGIYHTGNKLLWIKTDSGNDKRGVPIFPGEGFQNLYDVDKIYFGDIYAIYDSGPGGQVYVTWF